MAAHSSPAGKRVRRTLRVPDLDQAVESAERLPDRRVVVPAVNVVEVEVVGPEPVERPLDLRADGLSREVLRSRAVHRPVNLRGDDDRLAVDAVEPVADPAFARPVDAVVVGGVDEVAPEIVGGVQEVERLLAVRLHGSVGLLSEPPRSERNS